MAAKRDQSVAAELPAAFRHPCAAGRGDARKAAGLLHHASPSRPHARRHWHGMARHGEAPHLRPPFLSPAPPLTYALPQPPSFPAPSYLFTLPPPPTLLFPPPSPRYSLHHSSLTLITSLLTPPPPSLPLRHTDRATEQEHGAHVTIAQCNIPKHSDPYP